MSTAQVERFAKKSSPLMKLGAKGRDWPALRTLVDKLSPISRHDAVKHGVSTQVLVALMNSYERISKPEVYAVVGISDKTATRRKDQALPRQVSDATLALIEITSTAERVLGSHRDAEEWLLAPAMALDGRKPIELIATRAGAELVKAHLIRLDYGVYA